MERQYRTLIRVFSIVEDKVTFQLPGWASQLITVEKFDLPEEAIPFLECGWRLHAQATTANGEAVIKLSDYEVDPRTVQQQEAAMKKFIEERTNKKRD